MRLNNIVEKEIKVIKYYNGFTKSCKANGSGFIKLTKQRNIKAIELNLLRKLKKQIRKG
jgi:hypothetical protein